MIEHHTFTCTHLMADETPCEADIVLEFDCQPGEPMIWGNTMADSYPGSAADIDLMSDLDTVKCSKGCVLDASDIYELKQQVEQFMNGDWAREINNQYDY